MTNTLPRHIVLIDDDSDDFNVLNYIVEDIKANARITSVTDTENLPQQLKRDLPDLIFLDLAMPKKSGLDCLQEIRRDEELKDIPVIVYTDSVNTSEIGRAQKLGAFLYVQKPSSYSQFVKTISDILSLDPKIPQSAHYILTENRPEAYQMQLQ